MSALAIVHLYPRELGINGDVGNVTALETRARWRGLGVTVHQHHPGGALPESFDLVHIGSGPLSSQRAVHDDVLRIAPMLADAVAGGVPVLAIAGGWQLLSHGFRTPDGEEVIGAGVFPSHTVIGRDRTVGEIMVSADSVMLAGFENHAGTTSLRDGAEPLGRVVSGGGNVPGTDRAARTEGMRFGASIGTHMHGPILPMNPTIADELMRAALRHSNSDSADTEWPESDALRAVDASAAKSREAIAARLGVRA